MRIKYKYEVVVSDFKILQGITLFKAIYELIDDTLHKEPYLILQKKL